MLADDFLCRLHEVKEAESVEAEARLIMKDILKDSASVASTVTGATEDDISLEQEDTEEEKDKESNEDMENTI